MKELIICVFALFAFCSISFGQDVTGADKPVVESQVAESDSLLTDFFTEVLADMMSLVVKPSYKMYKTSNAYNLIKLNTATGALWQVQIRLSGVESMTVPIDSSSLLSNDETPIPGRFELYETNNDYNFILLDGFTGKTYQVQWNTEPRKRFRERLY